MTDPATLSTQLVREVRKSSTVTVDGTARVAGRSAYELVLTPKPDERTLLREVRVAVDYETRLPLELSVMTNGTTEPALRAGFTDLDIGTQPAKLFQFTPPEGAKVTEEKPERRAPQRGALDAKTVGEGWDTVLLTKLPAELGSGKQARGSDGGNVDVRGILHQVGKRVSGPYGSGYMVTTTAATALVTDDGRIAVGAVPEQVLVDALEKR
jgi:hypothetical protein